MSLTVGELISFCAEKATEHPEEICEELKGVCMVIGGIISKILGENNITDGVINSGLIKTINGEIEKVEKEDELYESFANTLTEEERDVLDGLNIVFEEGGFTGISDFLNNNNDLINKLPKDSKIHIITTMLFNGDNFNDVIKLISSKYKVQIENPRSEVVQRYINEVKYFLLSKLGTHQEVTSMQ